MSNNKRRLLTLIQVLTKQSDKNNPISENNLKAILSKDDIDIKNRKTIYEDINVLNEYGYNVIYDTKSKGYYLESSPFTLPEIKILLDEINDLKDFDSTELKNKLLSFVSEKQEHLLDNQVIYRKTKSSKIKYIDKISLILDAIENNYILNIEYNNKQNIIKPYYLHFSNGKYYLYSMFEGNNNIYSYRIDKIKRINILDDKFDFDDSIIENIKKKIKTSYDNYNKNKPTLISLSCDNYEKLINRLDDDFPEHYLDNKGNIIIEYDPNEIFFSKLVSYGKELKIENPKEIKKAYIDYLNSIIRSYK